MRHSVESPISESERLLTGELGALESALVDRYRVIREVGRGGSGIVYEAQDLRNEQSVAIKVLRVELAGARARRRFLQEIEFAKRLDHPNILRLLDSGEVGDITYYVMPFVAGESLQQRLARDGQQPLGEVVRVARAVLEALAHAHAAAIAHRDIKPGNILLDGKRVLVGDFGIARALHRTAADERISSPGVNVGTPAYMSPEQASGANLDGRTDLYSLGCVMYEMVGGSVPFSGSTGTALIARHAIDPVPPLRTVRPSTPLPLERLVLRALEKSPADRFETAHEMISALDAASTPESMAVTTAPAGRGLVERRVRLALAVVAGLALAALAAWRFWPELPDVDQTAFLVFPFEVDGSIPGIGDPAQRLRDAMRSWSGVRVLDRFSTQVGFREEDRHLTPAQARRISRRLGAAQYVRGRVEPEGTAQRFTATLFDLEDGQLVELPIRMTAGMSYDSAYALLAERLLFKGAATDSFIEPTIGSRSVPARTAYLAGHAMLREWNLKAADSLFFIAASEPQGYPQAALWLAQVRYWREEEPGRWSDFAERGMNGAHALHERTRARALLLFAKDSVDHACQLFESMARQTATDGPNWLSSGLCRSDDDVVVLDPRSPTGWRFRSSHHEALNHLERAFRLAPALFRGVRNDGFRRLRFLLYTTSNLLKNGRATSPKALAFLAYPAVSGDTLVFYPIPLEDYMAQGPLTRAALAGVPAANRRQRDLLKEWTTTWSTNHPRSAEALEAVSIAFEAVGNASALDKIADARALVSSPVEDLRVRGTQAWLLAKFALPSDHARLTWAVSLADSVLQDGRGLSGDLKLQLGLAALTGRLKVATDIARRLRDWPLQAFDPAELNIVSGTLLLRAALGGSKDELRLLERRADSLVRVRLPDERWSLYRRDLIARAAVLAFPSHRGAIIGDTSIKRFQQFSAVQALDRGDSEGALAILNSLRDGRAAVPAEDLQVDVLLPEAVLLDSLVGPKEALAWISPTLMAIRYLTQSTFLDPVLAATLVRLMALHAELLHRTGDTTQARVWANAVRVLWKNCDPELRPLRDRMRKLTS